MAGRKPHSQAVVRQVLVLHAAGFAARRIGRALEISHTSVLQILAGGHPRKHPPSGLLLPSERRVPPQRCGRCRQRIDVLPCRICCGQQAPPRSPAASSAKSLDRRPADVLRRPPGAPKGAIPHALSLELTAEQWSRLQEVRSSAECGANGQSHG